MSRSAESRPGRAPGRAQAPNVAARSGWPLRLVIVAGTAAIIWWVAGELTRRTQASQLPPLPDLSNLPAAVRTQLADADRAARSRPSSADALGALGMAYHASQVAGLAMQAYAIAERLAPAAWRWTYYRALLHEDRGELDPLVEALTRVTAERPDLGLAWFRLAEARFKRRQFESAQQAYDRARLAPETLSEPEWQMSPRNRTPPVAAYATAGLARLALEQREPHRASALVDELVRTQPGFGPALRLQQQINTLAKAQPSKDDGVSARAYVPPADPLLDAVVRLSRHSDTLLKRAALAARAGDRPWREFLIQRALEFNPNDPDVLMEAAAARQATADPAGALEYLRQHERLVPGDHHGLVEQGKCLIDLGRFSEAEQVLRRAVRVPDAAAEYNLGVALDRQNRWDEARARYERALTLDPFHARASNNLGVGLARRGEIHEALAHYAAALAAAPANAEVYSNLANGLLQQGRRAEAITALERALAIDPRSADAHNNLGVALAQSGRIEEARTQFEEAVRLAPDHHDAQRNLTQLKKS